MNNVWPDNFVGGENLSRHISTLRKRLGENRDGQQFIETLSKFGYRFVAQVNVIEHGSEQTNQPQEARITDATDRFQPELQGSRLILAEPLSSAVAPLPDTIERASAAPQVNDTLATASIPRAVHKRRNSIILATLGLLLMVGVFGVYKLVNRKPVPSTLAGLPPKITPLTSFPNREYYPAFSPDDKQIAFTWDGEQGNNTDIYVKPVGSGAPLRLTTNPAAEISPVWSPDGRSIAFMRFSDQGVGIFQVPASGGEERELLTGFSSAGTGVPAGRLSWSPDGKLLAFAGTVEGKPPPLHLFLLSLDTLEKRQITATPEDDRCPVFSPDGQTLAFIRGWDEIYLIPVTGGEPRRLTFDSKRIFGLAWTPDSSAIIFSSARAGNPTLWKIAANGGTPEALTPSGEQVGTLALAHQGNRLVYAQNISDTNIWQRTNDPTLPDSGRPSLLISSTQNETRPQFSPDEKSIVFVSNRSGSLELWRCDSNGQTPVQLTSFNGPNVGNPCFSPDGQQIAFNSTADQDQDDIYIISLNGGVPRRLTTDVSAEICPSWSRDGRWIYFSSNRSGEKQIWKQPIAGGPAVQVTKQGGTEAMESSDGQFLYYTRSEELGIWRVPVAGGEETRILEQGALGYWAVTPQGIYFVNSNAQPSPTVEFFNFATSQIKSLAALEKLANGFAVSADGRRFLWAQVDRKESDLMFVENFR